MRCLLLLVAVTLIVIGVVTAQLGPGEECERGQCRSRLTCYSGRCRYLYGQICEVQEYESCEWGGKCQQIPGEDAPKCRMMPSFPCTGYGMQSPCASSSGFAYECDEGICKGTPGASCGGYVQCVNNGRCERGQCVIRIGESGCLHDHLCQDQAECIEGVCEPMYGQWCEDDLVCNSPATCIRGRCLLPYGARCRSDFHCQRSCNGGYCSIPLGEECDQPGPDNCESGYVCRGGICTYQPERRPCYFELPCVENADCVMGWCTFRYGQACSAEGRCEQNTRCEGGTCKIVPNHDCLETRQPLELKECVSGTECTSIFHETINMNGQNVAVPAYRCHRLANTECVENSQCHSERCIGGRCAIDVNEACSQNELHCQDNMVCEDGVCKISRGQLCNRMIDNPCMAGTVCREWCAALNEQPCVHHLECVSGECIRSQCALWPGDQCSPDNDLCPGNTQCGYFCDYRDLDSCGFYCLTPVGQRCTERHMCVPGASCTWNGRGRRHLCTKQHGQRCSRDEECDPHTSCKDGVCWRTFCGFCRPGSACELPSAYCHIWVGAGQGSEVDEGTTPPPIRV